MVKDDANRPFGGEMSTDPARLDDSLRTLRLRAGLTQQQLANKSGVSRIAISMIETGRQRPSKKIESRIAEALGVPLQSIHQFSHAKPFSSDRPRLVAEEPRFPAYNKIERLRQRVTLEIPPDFEQAIRDISQQQSTSKADIIRTALQSHLENIGYEISRNREDVGGQSATRKITIRSVKQVIFHSNLLIKAFEEALNYDVQRHHNQPPPTLRLEDEGYLREIKNLVAELKQLNEFLANLGEGRKRKEAPPIQLSKHIDIFLKKYSATLGYGAGMMTLGLMATLLYQLGAGEAVFDHVLKRIPGR